MPLHHRLSYSQFKQLSNRTLCSLFEDGFAIWIRSKEVFLQGIKELSELQQSLFLRLAAFQPDS